MKKKLITMCLITLIAVVVIYTVCYIGMPIKQAVKAPRYNNYIICRECSVTDFSWSMETEDGHTEYINILNDDEITANNYEFFSAGNKFYVYGHFADDNEVGKVFVLEDWDIIYPIKHGFPFFGILSKDFLFNFDIRAE